MMDHILAWAQPVVTVVSLTFGGGILYSDIQELKKDSLRAEELDRQVQVMEVKMDNAAVDRARMVHALESVTDVVDRLNTSVIKLESKLGQ